MICLFAHLSLYRGARRRHWYDLTSSYRRRVVWPRLKSPLCAAPQVCAHDSA